MSEIRRILCPVDFSENSRRALRHAVAIARYNKATVTVLHVFSPAPVAAFGPGPVAFEPIVLTDIDRDQLLSDVKAFADSEGAPGVSVEALVRDGSAVDEIVDQAATMNADLIVIGTHGRSGVERLILGSVAEKVLRKAACAVMTVPHGLPEDASADVVLYKRILCPIDFSDSSLHALKHATSLAREADGQLMVLHVVEHALEEADDMANIVYDAGMTIGDFLKEREEALRRRLQDVTDGARASCRAESLLTHGKPWRDVLRVAKEQRSDLIVMGVQGRGAADLLFFGSTTQHVVRAACCPVLTLRHA